MYINLLHNFFYSQCIKITFFKKQKEYCITLCILVTPIVFLCLYETDSWSDLSIDSRHNWNKWDIQKKRRKIVTFVLILFFGTHAGFDLFSVYIIYILLKLKL